MKIQIQVFTFGPFQENTYIVHNEAKEVLIIDPGTYHQSEKEALFEFLQSNQLKPIALLNTHAHLDHIAGNAFVLRKFDIPFYLHALDLPTLKMAETAANLYGLNELEPSPEPTHFLEDKQELKLGNFAFEVIFAPGHAPGHVAFYNAENNVLLGGDVLFQGSYGRTDLPGGNEKTLKNSILTRIFTLPDETVVLSGHGNPTTIGDEKFSNPIHFIK